MSKVTLQQLGKRGPPYRFVGNGLKVWYEKEDLDKWWAKAKNHLANSIIRAEI